MRRTHELLETIIDHLEQQSTGKINTEINNFVFHLQGSLDNEYWSNRSTHSRNHRYFIHLLHCTFSIIQYIVRLFVYLVMQAYGIIFKKKEKKVHNCDCWAGLEDH